MYTGQKVGYARVSSTGQSLEVQIEKLKNYGCTKIYAEKMSGIDQNRPALISCIDYVREHDTLVITKLDRMARSTLHLAKIVETIVAKKVAFVVIDQQGINTTTPLGKLMLDILSSFAEFEYNIRKERQMEGIQKAKKKGQHLGRPRTIDAETIQNVKDAIANDGVRKAIMREFKISNFTYYAIKNGRYDNLLS